MKKLQSEHSKEQLIIDIDRPGNIVEQQNKEDENRPNQYGNECREKFGKARLSKTACCNIPKNSKAPARKKG